MKRLLSLVRRRGEDAQATIFLALTLPLISMTAGLTIEGGRVYAEYRHLQAAADMAATAGAQGLPCNTTDSTCIQNSETVACNLASQNGFNSCTVGGTSAPTANVPPLSCSPYAFIDYGNGTTNANCNNGGTPPFYDYIEVQLSDQLGTIPIFNTPVTLYAHAVAKHGIVQPSDFALVTLSPSTPLDMSGSNTTEIIGSAFANGGIIGKGNDSQDACAGGWFTAGTVSGVSTDDTGTPNYAPSDCSGTDDATPDAAGSLPQISDPYSGSEPPPTVSGNGNPNSGTFVGCPECTQSGWWYDLDKGKWYQGGTPNGHAELFPGIYSSLPNGGGPNQQLYFNPGVYTFTSGIDTTGGGSCVYGAPACDDQGSSCPSSTFNYNTTAGNSWYYKCSPYGFWDSSTFNGTRPSSLPTTPPYWYNNSTGSWTTTPLNGVTIYLPPNSGGIQDKGNSNWNWLAAPNPCAGTGTFGSSSVSFPAGAPVTAGQSYSYGSDLAATHGLPSVDQRQVFPNLDLSLTEESSCTAGQQYEVWPGEMTTPQHLHFIFYIQGPGSDSKYRGASAQNYFGIWYAPTSNLTVVGAGKGSGGPPWVTGQIITNTITWSGNSYADIAYRPCGEGATACGSGGGTQLIQ